MRRTIPAWTMILALGLLPAPVFAHPHVWVAAREKVLFSPDGKIIGFRHVWTFDEMYSAFATEGLGKDGKPKGMLVFDVELIDFRK